MRSKFFICAVSGLIALSACGGGKKDQKLEDMIPAKFLEAPTSMTFDETSFDFDTIQQGSKVTHEFSFTNAGKNPLIIVNGFGTCGCTVPEFPKEPIAPGEKKVIKVQYNSNKKAGQQNKKVILIANTQPSKNEITITAFVKVPNEN